MHGGAWLRPYLARRADNATRLVSGIAAMTTKYANQHAAQRMVAASVVVQVARDGATSDTVTASLGPNGRTTCEA